MFHLNQIELSESPRNVKPRRRPESRLPLIKNPDAAQFLRGMSCCMELAEDEIFGAFDADDSALQTLDEWFGATDTGGGDRDVGACDVGGCDEDGGCNGGGDKEGGSGDGAGGEGCCGEGNCCKGGADEEGAVTDAGGEGADGKICGGEDDGEDSDGGMGECEAGDGEGGGGGGSFYVSVIDIVREIDDDDAVQLIANAPEPCAIDDEVLPAPPPSSPLSHRVSSCCPPPHCDYCGPGPSPKCDSHCDYSGPAPHPHRSGEGDDMDDDEDYDEDCMYTDTYGDIYGW